MNYNTEKQTRVYKSMRDGWMAETKVYTNGINWIITTSKGYRGINSTAQKVDPSSDGSSYSFTMFGDASINLLTDTSNATENKVTELHNKALEIFDAKQTANELPKLEVKDIPVVGSILWLNGYGQTECSHDRLAVYKIEDTNYGIRYHTVNLDKFTFEIHDHAKPASKMFGIGIYFNPGEVADTEEMNTAIVKAKDFAFAKREEEQKQKAASEAKRVSDIEIGKKIIDKIPDGVTHIIVATLQKDDSDIQTDYFAYSTTKTVYLAFSKHGRDLFSEMRKAAANFEETKRYAIAPVRPEGDAGKYWEPKDEHREKYSMGAGYYLGDSKYHGWIVEKHAIGGNYGTKLEDLQIAAAQGRYCIPTTSNDDVEDKQVVINVISEKTVRINEEKNGVEILFPGKPDSEILTRLKAKGFRWSGFNKVWYNKNTPANIEFANSL